MDDTPRRGPGRPPKARDDGFITLRIKRGYFPMNGGPQMLPGETVTVSPDEAAWIMKNNIGEKL